MPSLRKAGTIEIRSSGSTSSTTDFAARRGGKADEARDLDVVGADSVLPSSELVDALDVQHVRADALDARAERDEEAAEVLDVGLAGGVAEHGLPSASTAAMIAFSVPITDASSR